MRSSQKAESFPSQPRGEIRRETESLTITSSPKFKGQGLTLPVSAPNPTQRPCRCPNRRASAQSDRCPESACAGLHLPGHVCVNVCVNVGVSERQIGRCRSWSRSPPGCLSLRKAQSLAGRPGTTARSRSPPPCNTSPPGPQTTRARTGAASAHSTWPG